MSTEQRNAIVMPADFDSRYKVLHKNIYIVGLGKYLVMLGVALREVLGAWAEASRARRNDSITRLYWENEVLSFGVPAKLVVVYLFIGNPIST